MPYSSPIYPTEIPDYTDLREVTNDVDDIIATDHNDLMKELVAVLTELGTLPKGSAFDLKTRLAQSLNNDGSLKPGSLWTSVPSFPTSLGSPGEQAHDANFHYICNDTDTWLRVPLTSW